MIVRVLAPISFLKQKCACSSCREQPVLPPNAEGLACRVESLSRVSFICEVVLHLLEGHGVVACVVVRLGDTSN